MGRFGEDDTTGTGSYTVGFADYWKNGAKFTLTEDGTVTNISIYFSSNPNRTCEAVIYSTDAGGDPDAIEGKVSQTVNATGWVDFAASIALTAGDYVLTLCAASGSTFYILYKSGATYIDRQNDTPPAADPWGAHNQWSGKILCIYADYTTAPLPTEERNVCCGGGP